MAPSSSTTLVLVPTELEWNALERLGGIDVGLAVVRLSGFGPVASAARTARLLIELSPSRVLLCGIAGAFDLSVHPAGSACEFQRVAIDGIGVGEGSGFLSAEDLGLARSGALELASDARGAGLLLTVCAASATPEQAARRLARFPNAIAEDMEGYGVALACALERVPLRIVRGISNVVGDRRKEHWQITVALEGARALARELLSSTWCTSEVQG